MLTRKSLAFAAVAIATVPRLAVAETASSMSTCSIPFVGEASGGTLILCETLNRNAAYAAIETARGESAESVAQRLAQLLNNEDPLGYNFSPDGYSVSSSGGTLEGLPGTRGNYMVAGTETGLGIPPAPTSLTCNYAKEERRLYFKWRNKPGGYDRIKVVMNYDDYNRRGGAGLPGTSESWEIDLARTWPEPDLNEAWQNLPGDLDVWIVGVVSGIPSNAAAIHVNHNVQEELFGIPFSDGTAPNWTKWGTNDRAQADAAMGVSEKLTRGGRNGSYNAVLKANHKPFYQLIKSTPGAPSGIMREFLGLTPGHKYRLSIRLNTLAADRKGPGWIYSLHAMPTVSEVKLNDRQMAGTDPLPNGQEGEDAARIVKYDNQRMTNGKYEELATDIVLPPGKDCITVWLRLKGGTTGTTVAMDYVKLEDLGK